jgi:hypothetical protein
MKRFNCGDLFGPSSFPHMPYHEQLRNSISKNTPRQRHSVFQVIPYFKYTKRTIIFRTYCLSVEVLSNLEQVL